MKIITATIIFALFVFGNCTIPDYIHVCQHDDPDLGGCIKKSVEILRPRLASGIPELEVPPIEPLSLGTVSFNTASQATHLATNLTNLQVYGASNFEIIKIIPTLSKKGYKFQFEVLVPQLYVEGNYEIDSKILLLVLKGNGPLIANISNYHFNCEFKGHKVDREGENHLLFEKMTCNAVIGKSSIILKNLFNGNPLLEKATNDAINDNADAFFDEIRPNLVDALASKFTDISNKITLKFIYEELFP